MLEIDGAYAEDYLNKRLAAAEATKKPSTSTPIVSTSLNTENVTESPASTPIASTSGLNTNQIASTSGTNVIEVYSSDDDDDGQSEYVSATGDFETLDTVLIDCNGTIVRK